MKPITVTSYVRQGDSIRRLDSLTDAELEQFRARVRETFAAVVGDHMRTHPDEARAYAKAHPDRVEMEVRT